MTSGSTHDSHIFWTSATGGNLEEAGLTDVMLLGDSGYACSPFLMTLYLNPNLDLRRSISTEHTRSQDVL